MKDGNCLICKLVTILVSLGAINWGLVAFFQMDLVAQIFGSVGLVPKIIYGVIGVAGLIKLASLVMPCPCCKVSDGKK
jgi:uncharacterized membrane protein YuzA (DUF378 family)